MTARTCYLCAGQKFNTVPGKVRDRAEIGILECEQCGLVFLDSFAHITQDYYENSGMHAEGSDEEIANWLRESAVDDERRCGQVREIATDRQILDFGAGAGGFAERMRGIARRVDVVEPESRLAERFQQLGITRYASVAGIPDDVQYDLITLFHVLEHLPDPAETLKMLARHLRPGGRIIIEVPSANDALLKLYENKAFSEFTYWSCHLYLFTNATLQRLFDQCGLKTRAIKQIQRYGIANHMHWMSRGRPGGHSQWSFLDSAELHSAYEKQLAALGLCDTIFAEVEA